MREWITAVQVHYGLGPEASPADVFLVAAEQLAELVEVLAADQRARLAEERVERLKRDMVAIARIDVERLAAALYLANAHAIPDTPKWRARLRQNAEDLAAEYERLRAAEGAAPAEGRALEAERLADRLEPLIEGTRQAKLASVRLSPVFAAEIATALRASPSPAAPLLAAPAEPATEGER